MKAFPPPLCITAQEVSRITGRTLSTSYKLLTKIKKHYDKPKGALVTVEEFCAFMAFKKESVEKYR